MDDSVPRVTEFYEPMLQVRDACGLTVTILIGPGSSVNGFLFRRPQKGRGIPFCRVWQRLEDFSKFLGRLVGICFRLQRLRLACLMGKFSELPDQAETGELLLEALRVRRQTDGV